MTKRTAGSSTIPRNKSNYSSALKGGAWRRFVVGTVLRSLLLLACLSLPFMTPWRANAQAIPDALLTGYKFNCGGTEYNLAIVSVKTALKDQNRTPASSLGLVLIPSGNGPNKNFNIYSFGSAESIDRKRDDDEGAFDLKEYQPANIENNLANFLRAAPGCRDLKIPPILTAGMAQALQVNPVIPTAREFAQWVANKDSGDAGNLLPTGQPLPPFEAPASSKEFGQSVHQYSAHLKLLDGALNWVEGGSDNEGELQRLLKEWKGKAEKAEIKAKEQEELAKGLQERLDKLGQGNSPNYWLWVGLPLAAIILALAFYFGRRISFLSGKTKGDRGAPPDITAELAGILRNSQEHFQKLPPGRNDFCREAIRQLQNDITHFQRHRRPKASDELTRIVNYYRDELLLSEQGRSQHTYNDIYKTFWGQLDDYRKKYYSGPTGGSEQFPSGAPQPGEVKPAALTTPPGEGAATPAVTPTPTTSLDESSLSALEALFVKYLGNLPERLNGGQQQVKELWSIWCGQNKTFQADSFDTIVKINKEAQALGLMLRQRFKNDALHLKDSKGKLINLFDGLSNLRNAYLNDRDGGPDTPDSILAALGEKLRNDKLLLDRLVAMDRDYKTAQEKMGILLQIGNGDVFQSAQRLADEYKEILALVNDYRQGHDLSASKPVKALYSKADLLEKRLLNIERTVIREVPRATGAAEDMVNHLIENLHTAQQLAGQAARLQEERDSFKLRAETAEPEAHNAKVLAVEISRYLSFNAGKVDAAEKPVSVVLDRIGMETPLYRQLRLRLSAALLMLDEVLKAETRADVIKALRLESIRKELGSFAQSLEDLNPDEIWERGVSSGYKGSWLHDLFRANLLLQNYFSDVAELYELSDAVAQACSVLETAMHHRGVQIVPVKLFEDPPDGVEPDGRAGPSFGNLPEVKDKVGEEFRARQRGKFVVDVMAFSVKINGVQQGVGQVVTMNPSYWEIDLGSGGGGS